jgi:hypothetical protein
MGIDMGGVETFSNINYYITVIYKNTAVEVTMIDRVGNTGLGRELVKFGVSGLHRGRFFKNDILYHTFFSLLERTENLQTVTDCFRIN